MAMLATPGRSQHNLGLAVDIHSASEKKRINWLIANVEKFGWSWEVVPQEPWHIRYVSGDQDQLKFGITLKNVGPVMRYKGDGLAQQVTYVSTGYIASLEQRSATFELPSLLGIGMSYDFIFNESNKLNLALGFTANSFMKDQFRAGLDYGIAKDNMAFNLRAGFCYENGMFNEETKSSAFSGPSAGFSIDALVGENQNALGLEYAARFAGVLGMIHTIGATISLK